MARAKILMVDDNPDIVELMASRLEGNDYEVVRALGGAEALEKAEKERPDLILLDISMPEMDGFEVGRRLRLNRVTQYIPIIMVTARGQHKDVVCAVNELQAADYLIKPFRPEILLAKIEQALNRFKPKE